MLFNSWTFVIFALVTFFTYYFLPFRKYQLPVLIAASFFFYAWENPWLLLLLLCSVLVNASVSYQLAHRPQYQSSLILGGILFNLSILGFFKYGGLLSGNLIHVLLPIGISFYTFEGISLLLDTAQQREAATQFVRDSFAEHLLRTALFIAFFPHLIAGPILKARNFYSQINSKTIENIPWTRAFQHLTLGYFLKMVVADNLKDYTFWIAYPYYETLGLTTSIFLLFGYSIQIFADFAGYSLIALGLAELFGYDIPNNFNYPYIAHSIANFWQRWHISLSTWLRDYLYIPLGGNRKGKLRTYLNLIVVMVLGGLWHGAAWSYGIWGLYHGLGLALERWIRRGDKTESRSIFSTIFVFCFVSFGWLFFKLPKFEEVIGFVVSAAHNFKSSPNPYFVIPVLIFSMPVLVYHGIQLSEIQMVIKKYLLNSTEKRQLFKNLAFGFMLAALVLNSGRSSDFIYFQF
jgi:alginate O-acetyltransferase complex protein AlgI